MVQMVILLLTFSWTFRNDWGKKNKDAFRLTAKAKMRTGEIG